MAEAAETATRTVRLTVDASDANARADRVLARGADGLSRSRIKGLVEAGHLAVDGRTVADPAHRVKAGAELTLTVPPAAPAKPEAQAIALDVVHEDPHLIVVIKPAGMVVHPAPGAPDGTLVNALIAHCGDELTGIGGEQRPGIVHRLDKDTSGLMVAAKTETAHAALVEQFAARSIERSYTAVVWGVPAPTEGACTSAIGRHPVDRKRMAVRQRGGRAAETHYRVTRVLGARTASLVECRLKTGRTHQIRVHLAHAGHPLVADPTYGRRRIPDELAEPARHVVAGLGRQALHAATLGFTHPVTGERLRFTSPIPQDIQGVIDAFSGG
ncbi:RluA family pseudouridine synthase [Limimonas halophila]|nr:RluA family pseudouridine synthase [Limimonas halophila]